MMQVKSKEFNHGQKIPSKFTCLGQNINPSLEIENIPKKAKTLVLIIDDPDAPKKTFVHWVVFNILVKGDHLSIGEDSIPGIEGSNDFQDIHYGGPCPPSGVHRYFFKIYALDTVLKLSENSSKAEVEKAMEGHILEQAVLMGLFEKSH